MAELNFPSKTSSTQKGLMAAKQAPVEKSTDWLANALSEMSKYFSDPEEAKQVLYPTQNETTSFDVMEELYSSALQVNGSDQRSTGKTIEIPPETTAPRYEIITPDNLQGRVSEDPLSFNIPEAGPQMDLAQGDVQEDTPTEDVTVDQLLNEPASGVIEMNETTSIIDEPVVSESFMARPSGRAESFTGPSPKRKIDNEAVQNSINFASEQTGVPESYLQSIAKIESGFNPNAKAKTSSAGGLFQFVDNTWNSMVDKYGDQMGIPANASKAAKAKAKFDPQANAMAAALYTKDNENYVKKKLGRELNDVDRYMSHFLGATGAARFLKAMEADNNVQAYRSVTTNTAKSNKNIFYINGDKTKPRTVRQVYQLMGRKLLA